MLDFILLKLQNKDPIAIAFAVSSFCTLASIYSLYYQYLVRHWPFVWGELKHKEVDKFGGTESVKSDQDYAVDVKYTYTVNDKDYLGNRLSAMVVITSHNLKQLLQKQLKGVETSNGKVKVYYNPKKPQKSFLINASKFQVTFTLAMMIFMFLISIKCLYKLQIL